MPLARRIAEEYSAFSQVSRDRLSIQRTGIWKSSRRLCAVTTAIGGSPPCRTPPVTRTGSCTRRNKMLHARSRSRVSRPGPKPGSSPPKRSISPVSMTMAPGLPPVAASDGRPRSRDTSRVSPTNGIASTISSTQLTAVSHSPRRGYQRRTISPATASSGRLAGGSASTSSSSFTVPAPPATPVRNALAARAKPVQHAPQPVAQRHRRAQAEHSAGQVRRADGVADLAGARRGVADVGRDADKLGDGVYQLGDTGGAAGADIENRRVERAPRRDRPLRIALGNPLRGAQRGDHVGDRNEVARLQTVAEHLDRRTAPQPLAEDRDDAGIGRARVLPWAVDVEEAQPDRRDVMDVARDHGVQLAAVFVGAVGGERTFWRGLGDRQVRTIAVNRGGGGVDHRDLSGLAAHRVEQRDGAGQIGAMGAEPIIDPAGDRGDGGEMKAAVHTGYRRLNRVRIGDVALDQLDAGRQVGALSGGQVVEYPHGVAVTDQRVAQMRADEAGTAGDEIGEMSHTPGLARIRSQRQPDVRAI